VQWWKQHWAELAFPKRNALIALSDYALEDLLQQPVFKFDDRPVVAATTHGGTETRDKPC
jgi:hypothetical protein